LAGSLQPSIRRGRKTIDTLSRAKVPAWLAPTDGDIVSATRELANRLVTDQIDAVIFDTTQADAIAAVIADWNVAKAKINLVRKSPLYAAGIQSVCYTNQSRFEQDAAHWQRANVDSRYIQEGIDSEEPLGATPDRSFYGIPDNAVVLATLGTELDRSMSEDFVATMVDILRAHPHAVYLLIGEGVLAWQKRKFDAAGVGKRVGYTGRRRDLPGFLRIADLYVAEFKGASPIGVMQAMSVERPVVAMKSSDAADESQAAEIVGPENAIATRDIPAYFDWVCKLIREPQYRVKLGRTMRARVDVRYDFNQTVRQIEALCERLVQYHAAVGPAQADPIRLVA
jgi:glycosyltransferase involved in cell wall biosynthesis